MGWKDDETRDLPLYFSFTSQIVAERLTAGGFPTSADPDVRAAAARIATELQRKRRGHLGRATSFSKNRNKYGGAALRGALWRLPTVTTATALLHQYGLASVWDAPQHRSPGRQSTIIATDELADVLGNFDDIEHDPGDAIRVNDRAGNPITVRQNEVLEIYRRNLDDINEASAAIKWSHPDLGEIALGDPIAIDQHDGGLARFTYHRVFCIDGSLSLHGRLYGHTVQCLPKAMRVDLLINEQETTEVDFARLHIGQAYRVSGAILTADPYDIEGHPTDIVKRAVNVALNARSRQDAEWVVASKMADPAGTLRRFIMFAPPEQRADAIEELRFAVKCNRRQAYRLLDEIERRHRLIANLFYSDAGMKLMAIDSFMMEAILLGLVRKGIPFGAIHDSVIVPSADRASLVEEMVIALHRAYSGESVNIPAGYSKSSYIWHRGVSPSGAVRRVSRVGARRRVAGLPALSGAAPVGSPGLGSAGVAVLMPRQGDLFGSPRVPVGSIVGLDGGVSKLDPTLVAAVGSLGLPNQTVASRIGISREHWANARSGRYGLSADKARNLQTLIYENTAAPAPF